LQKLGGLIPADLSAERWLKVETATQFVAKLKGYMSPAHCISGVVSVFCRSVHPLVPKCLRAELSWVWTIFWTLWD